MLKASHLAPAFRLSPAAKKKVDNARFYTDIIGLGIVYTAGGLIPASLQWILSIYTVMAWVTIFTIDPTRLPDAAATKINQNKAWMYVGVTFPIYAILIGILLYNSGTTHLLSSITFGRGFSILISACLIELYYRNVLQAKLRQLGLSVLAAIAVQSLCFALHFYITNGSLFIAAGSFILSVINGIIVYKTRSIYPCFTITFLWFFFFSFN